MMNFLKAILAVVTGVLVGAALGLAFALAVAMYEQWQNPSDPSAGAIAIVAIFTMPLGAVIGLIIGGIVGLVWL